MVGTARVARAGAPVSVGTSGRSLLVSGASGRRQHTYDESTHPTYHRSSCSACYPPLRTSSARKKPDRKTDMTQQCKDAMHYSSSSLDVVEGLRGRGSGGRHLKPCACLQTRRRMDRPTTEYLNGVSITIDDGEVLVVSKAILQNGAVFVPYDKKRRQPPTRKCM